MRVARRITLEAPGASDRCHVGALGAGAAVDHQLLAPGASPCHIVQGEVAQITGPAHAAELEGELVPPEGGRIDVHGRIPSSGGWQKGYTCRHRNIY